MEIRNFRLGEIRRFQRDYSVKLRACGLDAGDRMKLAVTEELLSLQSCSFLANQANLNMFRLLQDRYPHNIVITNMIQCLERSLKITANSYFLLKVNTMNLQHQCWLNLIPSCEGLSISNHSLFSNTTYIDIGFSKVDCVALFHLLGIPEQFTLNALDPRRKFKVSGVHSFLYTLYRELQVVSRTCYSRMGLWKD